MDSVTKAKRLIEQMEKKELQAVQRCLRERWELLEKHEARQYRQAKVRAPRGTKLEIVAFDVEGRRRKVKLQTEQEKSWWFNGSTLESLDIMPAGEVDLRQFPRVLQIGG
jgi:hypothetical protein